MLFIHLLILLCAVNANSLVPKFLQNNKELKEMDQTLFDEEEVVAVEKYRKWRGTRNLMLQQYSEQYPPELTHTPITEKDLKELIENLNLLQFRIYVACAVGSTTRAKRAKYVFISTLNQFFYEVN